MKDLEKLFIEGASNYIEKFTKGVDFLDYNDYYYKDELRSDVPLYHDNARNIDPELVEGLVEVFYDLYHDAVSERTMEVFNDYKAGNLEGFDSFDLEWMEDCDDDELLEGLQEGWFDAVNYTNFIADLFNDYVWSKDWDKLYNENIAEGVEEKLDEVVQYHYEEYNEESDWVEKFYEGKLRDFVGMYNITTDMLVDALAFYNEEIEYIDEEMMKRAITHEGENIDVQ